MSPWAFLSVDEFLDRLSERLDAGAIEYGNQSMAKSAAALEEEVRQELLDEAGWIYMLWIKACRKLGVRQTEKDHRVQFLHVMRHRLARNDRGSPDQPPGAGLRTCLVDLEIACMNVFEHAQRLHQDLHRIARAIEVAEAIRPHESRGRAGSIRDHRSDD